MPDINFAQVFIGLVVLLFSLTVHESAHAWAANRLGDPTARLLGRVSLNPLVHIDPIGTLLFPLIAAISNVPLIGWAKPVPVNVGRLRRGRTDYVLVAAAGPASNLLLALVASLVLTVMPVSPMHVGEPNLSAPLARLFTQGLVVNVFLALFNLIPIPPLDGGNIVSGLLPRSLRTLYDSLRPYGFLLIYALMYTGGIQYLVSRPAYRLVSWLL